MPKAESAPPERIQLCRRTRRQKGSSGEMKNNRFASARAWHSRFTSVGDAGDRCSRSRAPRWPGRPRTRRRSRTRITRFARATSRPGRSRRTPRRLDGQGNFSLTGLSTANYIVELVNKNGKVVCTEGPFDLSTAGDQERRDRRLQQGGRDVVADRRGSWRPASRPVSWSAVATRGPGSAAAAVAQFSAPVSAVALRRLPHSARPSVHAPQPARQRTLVRRRVVFCTANLLPTGLHAFPCHA